MYKESLQNGMQVIIQALARPGHMKNDQDYDRVFYLNRHPFGKDIGTKPVCFVGFDSDDIYKFIASALDDVITPLKSLTFYLCALEDPKQKNVFAEIEDQHCCYLVAGMTNYSGSGGYAYKCMQDVFILLGQIYDTDPVPTIRWHIQISQEKYELAYNMINQEVLEQMQEEES